MTETKNSCDNHCVSTNLFSKRFYSPLSDEFNQLMPLGPKHKKSSCLKQLGLDP